MSESVISVQGFGKITDANVEAEPRRLPSRRGDPRGELQ
jgi:hypothetical protein